VADPEKPFRHPAAISALLFAGTILLFGRAAWFGFVNVDDTDYVLGNPHVQRGLGADAIAWALTGVHSANWHPLTWISHMVDFGLFGAEPGGHHAVNVLWHAVNAVLAFLALRRLTGATATSAACAALFAWHPLRAESVAWVSERKDVLSGFFFFATLWLWAGFAGSRRSDARLPRGASYALALVAFALGLASKPMLVTLPFVLLLLDWWPLRRLRLRGISTASPEDPEREPRRQETAASLLLEKLPLFLLSAAAAVATYLAQDTGGAMLRSIPLDVRLGNAVVSVARYLGKLVWPFGLSIMYSYPERWPAAAVGGALALVVGATALALWQWRRRPWLLVGWLWFLGMLVPVLGLVQVGVQAMADRYTYLPVVGLQIALLWTVRDLVAGSVVRMRAAAATTAVLVALLAVRAWVQVGVWRSSATLFAHATAVNEDSYLAHSNYGLALAEENRHAEAEQSFRRVLEIDPPHFTAETLRENEYTVRYALGVMLLRQQRFDEAGEQLRRVLALVPDHLDANNHYGAILAMQGRLDEARTRFETALRYNPSSAPAHANLARIAMMQGDPEGAVRGYRRSIELQPADPTAHCGLAEALQRAGRGDEAARHRAEARRLVGDPQACPG
jgi:Flp pilus assembly protein TadD